MTTFRRFRSGNFKLAIFAWLQLPAILFLKTLKHGRSRSYRLSPYARRTHSTNWGSMKFLLHLRVETQIASVGFISFASFYSPATAISQPRKNGHLISLLKFAFWFLAITGVVPAHLIYFFTTCLFWKELSLRRDTKNMAIHIVKWFIVCRKEKPHFSQQKSGVTLFSNCKWRLWFKWTVFHSQIARCWFISHITAVNVKTIWKRFRLRNGVFDTHTRNHRAIFVSGIG